MLENESLWRQNKEIRDRNDVKIRNLCGNVSFVSNVMVNFIGPGGISALLPLFFEKAASIAMNKHGMTIAKEEIARLNPEQIPIIVGYQSLFALCKYVQWTWPDNFGASWYVVFLGGMHLEMALWRVLGDLLDHSGWTKALSLKLASPHLVRQNLFFMHHI